MSKLTDEKIADLMGRVTKGPWRAGEIDDPKGPAILDAGEHYIATAHDHQIKGCHIANAEAIALVPDLLAEVARLRSELEAAKERNRILIERLPPQ